jgi:CHAT domain-containing protein
MAQERAYRRAAADLSRAVLGVVAPLVERHPRVLVVPDGVLHYIPFAALPMPDERGPGSRARTPLGEAHQVVHLPSASAVSALRTRQSSRPSPERSVAIIADPVFEPDDPRFPWPRVVPAATRRQAPSASLTRALRDTGGIDGRFTVPRLLATRREARGILDLAPDATAALGFDATRAFVGGLAPHRIVHFATHGVLDDRHAELSGIVLSLYDRDGRAHDGFLRVHDVRALAIPADLVVLSACATGLGKEVDGEGLVGLSSGFMHAGASRVLASLWRVDDEATSELMTHFYRRVLKEGHTAAEALRLAQDALRRQPRYSHPYYWAAFILQGEWR